jgi:hypothetical protein
MMMLGKIEKILLASKEILLSLFKKVFEVAQFLIELIIS